MKIIAVGDIMPGGVLNSTDRQYVTDDVKELLAKGDLRVGTLETAIGNVPDFYYEKMKRKADVIYAEDDDLKRLVELNINIVSLANNHFFDLGPQGAEHTIDLLDKLGIKHCGGGRNIEEASKPVVETINGKTIAFLSFCDWREETTGWCPFATADSPGVNPMYDDYVVSEIRKYRPLYDYIVAIPHWGREYQVAPTNHVYKLAKKMVTNGVDLIIGGHTHCAQPVVRFGKAPVIFSMGNFLFPDRLLNYPRSTYYSKDIVDFASLPKTNGYPRYVEEPTLKVWSEMARYGSIVEVLLDNNRNSFNTVYTHLTYDNMVVLVGNNMFYSNQIKIYSKILKMPFYTYILFLVRATRSIAYRIIRFFRI